MLTVTCFHTNPTYAAAAARLVASGARFGVGVTAYERPDRGAWWANVAYKPHVLHAARQAAAGPLLHADADCEIVGPLDDLPALLAGYDLLVRTRPGVAEPNNGVMLLAPTAEVGQFLRAWAALTDRYAYRHETGDQGTMTEAARACGLRVGQLPPEYNAMPGEAAQAARIVHHKASRDDPALAAWKAARRLEAALADRLAADLAAPPPDRLYLYGPAAKIHAPPPGGEAQVVDRVAAPGAAVAWVADVAGYVTAGAAATVPSVVLPAETGAGNTADYLRHRLRPKPSGDAPPPRVRLYYPAAAVPLAFARRELSGAGSWAAAVNAAGVRGVRRAVLVGCPPGHRHLAADAAEASGVRLEFA